MKTDRYLNDLNTDYLKIRGLLFPLLFEIQMLRVVPTAKLHLSKVSLIFLVQLLSINTRDFILNQLLPAHLNSSKTLASAGPLKSSPQQGRDSHSFPWGIKQILLNVSSKTLLHLQPCTQRNKT